MAGSDPNAQPGGVPQVTLPDVVVTPDEQPPQPQNPNEPGFHDGIKLASGGALDLSKQPDQIAPIDQLSAQRIAAHAGVPQPAPDIAPLDTPLPSPSSLDVVPPETRYHYAEAVRTDDTTTPQNFSERLAGAAWSAVTGGLVDDGHNANAARITNATSALAGALPHPDDNDTYAAYLAHKVFGTAPQEIVDGISQNLMTAWRDSGVTPDKLMQRAEVDPDVAARLANPLPTPPQQSPYFPKPEDVTKLPPMPLPSEEESSQSSANTGFNTTGTKLAGAIKDLFSGLNPDEYMKAASHITGADAQHYFDVDLQPGEKLETPEGKQLAKNEAEPPTLSDIVGFVGNHMLGTVSPRPSRALGGGPYIPQNGVLKAWLDERFPTFTGEGAQIASDAKTIFNRNAGQANNVKQIVGSLLEEFRPIVNKYIPEDRQFNKDIAAHAEAYQQAHESFISQGGKEGEFTYDQEPPELSQLQILKDHIEDRPGGGRLPEDHPLYPLAETLAGVNKGMRGEIEREWDVEGYIDNYYRHAYAEPEKFDRVFGRRGDASSFQQRSIPYTFDAKMRGLVEKYPDPLDNTFRDIQGKVDYIASNRNIRHLEEAGMGQWGRRAPDNMPHWRSLDGVERPPEAPEKQPTPGPTPAPLQIEGIPDIEMANKIEGPAAQGQLTGPPGQELMTPEARALATRQELERSADPLAAQQRLLNGPLPGAEPEPVPVGRTRPRSVDKERFWTHPATAQIYNNMVGQGFHSWPIGNTLAALQRAGNFSTAMHFAMAGGHLMNMGWETMNSGLAHGMGEVMQGEVTRGLLDMGMSATMLPRAISNYRTATAFEQTLLDKGDTLGLDPRMRQLYIDTNARMTGRGNEMSLGQSRNLYKAWRQGGLALRAQELFKRANVPPGETLAEGITKGTWQALKGAGNLAGDIVSTASAPLFDKLVPRLRLGQWVNDMSSALRANPDWSDMEALSHGNMLADAMDNRFGEMNQDRIYIPRAMKQVLNATLLSTGWKVGTWRQFGDSVADLLRGKNTVNSRWLLAAPITTAIIGSVYELAATGHGPDNFKDLAYNAIGQPQSGDRTASGQPGRSQFLNPFKEFFDLYNSAFDAYHAASPTQAAGRILLNYYGQATNPGMKAAIDFWTSPEGQAWHQQVLRDLIPQSIWQQNPNKNNHIGPLATWLSFKPSPRTVTEPAALADLLNKHAAEVLYQEQYKAWRADQQQARPTLPKPNRALIYQQQGTFPTGRAENPVAEGRPRESRDKEYGPPQ